MLPDLSAVETATLGRVLRQGFMVPSIQALLPGTRIFGPALTVRLPGPDGTALIEALSVAEPGEVIVIDRCGDLRHACFGAVMGHAACARGVAGVVIDGFVTDRAALEALGLPVWCRGRSPLTTRLRNLAGDVGGLITCGGATVARGDIILADENGVAVLDPAEAARHAATALRLQQEEAQIIRGLQEGRSLSSLAAQNAGFFR
ncbi:RraA family protein [Salipiger pacificus]|nr:RraA family protein [Alloyangia pacifica]